MASKGSADGPPVDLFSFRNLPSYRLHLLSSVSEGHMEGVYRELYGLKLIECRIIGITGGYGEVAFRTICLEANLQKSYASRLIHQLVDRGLLTKVGNTVDQRQIDVALTEEGRRVHAAMYATAIALNAAWTDIFTPAERDTFLSMLGRLTIRMREMAGELVGDAQAEATVPPLPAPAPMVQLSETLARTLHTALGAALGDPHPGAID